MFSSSSSGTDSISGSVVHSEYAIKRCNPGFVVVVVGLRVGIELLDHMDAANELAVLFPYGLAVLV